MIDLLLETLGFAMKAGTVVLAFAAVGGIIASIITGLMARRMPSNQGHLQMRRLNSHLRDLGRQVRHAGLRGKAVKQAYKADKKADKAAQKAADKAVGKGASQVVSAAMPSVIKRVFVLDFEGDVRARRVERLREEITAIIAGAQDSDEVLLRLSSPGGAVTGYGLAASQLARLAQRNISLTVSIDQVAASGGYMMACVADRIIAAPFAMVGSIGVVATVPNVRQVLLRHGVEVEQLTAGKHKRTLSMLGENTDEGRAHFQADLDDLHTQFKEHVSRHRPQVDVTKGATGGHWTADRAVGLGMVDELLTSDDWLLARQESHTLITLKWQPPQRVSQRFSVAAEAMLGRVAERFWSKISRDIQL